MPRAAPPQLLAPLALIATLALLFPGVLMAQPGVLGAGSAIYDAPRQRMLVFGGQDDFAIFHDEVWQLGLGAAPVWTQLATTGTPPSKRFGHTAVYDSRRERMIVFGGQDNTTSFADVWALSLSGDSAWSQLTPSGIGPAARRFHTAIYDSVRDRMLVFGGQDANSAVDETWCLYFSPSPMWQRINRSARPTARFGHSAIFVPGADSTLDRMIVYGGHLSDPIVWSFSLGDTGSWTSLPTSGDPPGRIVGHRAVYDQVGDRMIVFGGAFQAGGLSNDVWTLAMTAPYAWDLLPASGRPPGRYYHALVCDRAYRRLVSFGGYDLRKDTWGFSLAGENWWSPLKPEIRVSADTLWLPTITVGDVASAALTLTNTGLQPLHITANPPAGMSLSDPGPFSLNWNQALRDTVRLETSDTANLPDNLILASDDPSRAQTVVTLVPDVHAIQVRAHVLGDPHPAPLGAALPVIVTPRPPVHIDGGQLYYRVDGAAGWDSVALTPLSTDFLATIPAETVTDRGVDYFVRAENNGHSALEPATAPDSFFTQDVRQAAEFEARPRPSSGSDFPTRQAIEVPLLLPDGATFQSGAILFRRGGEHAFASAVLTLDPLGRPYGTIPASFVGPRGVEYRVELSAGQAQLQFPPPGSPPRVIQTREHDLTEPAEHAGMRYRLVSVPLDFGANFTRSIESILTDQLGVYDPLHWRAYVWDAVAKATVEFSGATAAKFQLEPGRAFWLVTRDPHRVDISPLDGLSTSTAADDTILLQPGWNQIGNPFDFPVAWDSVSMPDSIGPLFGFDQSLGRIGDYSGMTPTVLLPFEGYFVENEGSSVKAILVPPREFVPAAAASHAATAASGDLWRFRLAASTASAIDAGNEFGVNGAAAAGFDALDASKPPTPPGPWVRIAFAHPEWGRRSSLYRRDIRSPGAAGETWEVEVRSATAGEPITLDLEEIAPAPGIEVSIADRELGVDAAHRRAGESTSLRWHIVSKGAHPYRLSIVAGSAAYVAQATEDMSAIPARLALEPNAPNPFRFATRFRFGLPRSEPVSVEVYSLLGQRVASLLDHAALAPGYHSVVWDGTSRGGAPVASGIYLLRLAAGAETLTRRVVLVR